MGEGAAQSVTHADRVAARSATKYDAVHSHEEGGGIGIALAAAAWRSASLRHALEPAATGRELRPGPRRWLARVLGWLERADDPALPRRHRHLPGSRSTVRIDTPGRAAVLIENAPGSGTAAGAGPGGSDSSDARRRPGRARRALHRHVRALPGARSVSTAPMALVVGERPEARLVLVGGEAAQVEAARRGRAGPRHCQAPSSLPGSGPPTRSPRISTPRRCSSRRAPRARTRR